jgi:hypothetical protein
MASDDLVYNSTFKCWLRSSTAFYGTNIKHDTNNKYILCIKWKLELYATALLTNNKFRLDFRTVLLRFSSFYLLSNSM